ncbi:MAG: amino acid adenylation domain-containing protein [Bacteroidales bacterium]|nr:amino acid adenylation domain-containing protein [Bacteroidales bacterium]
MKINLIEYFIETVKRFPDRTAIVDGEKRLSFSELDIRARKMAKVIVDTCQCKNRPIAMFMPKSAEALQTDLAITYSGNTYMNLDVKNPAERLGNILALIQPAAVITNSRFKAIIEPIASDSINVLNIDEMAESTEFPSADWFLSHISNLIDTDPYCIINTSGSTGTPKGVVLNHKSFIDFMAQTFDEYRFSENDVIGSLSPVVFDIWSYEMCLLMGKGACIVVIPDTYSAFPVKILQLMQQHSVSYIFWVPTIMVNIANMGLLEQVKLPALRLCWFAGEVFPTKQFNIWRHNLPQTTFANFYGPIEITLDCVYYTVEREIADDEPIPIGKPFRNTDILILDENNQNITEANKEGELCIRGTSLAMGYYNNPEKTAAAFVQNPLNQSYPEIIYRTGDMVFINDLGEIVFKGRKDSLIKHMGYRIELGEIEHVIINTLKLVKNGCVVYQHQRKEITLYYEAENELTAADFRKAIGNTLPKYMVPVVYHHLPELKRNTNGKIDRLYYSKLVEE